MSNPFNLVFDELWQMVDDHANLESLIKDGNRIRFNREKLNPLKINVLDGDLPELILVSVGIVQGNLFSTSSSSMCIRNYQWLISTGDLRIETINDIVWELFRVTSGWKQNLSALTWQDKAFVKRVNFTSSSEGQSDPERNRGIKGWSSLLTIEVEMHFQTNDLKSGAQ